MMKLLTFRLVLLALIVGTCDSIAFDRRVVLFGVSRGGGDEETLSDYEKAEETIFHAVEDVEKAIVHAIEDEVDTVFPPPEHKTEEENEAGTKKQKKKVAKKEGGGDEETLSDYKKAEEKIFHAVEDAEKATVHAIEDEINTMFDLPKK